MSPLRFPASAEGFALPFRLLLLADTHYDLGDPGHAEVDALLDAALDALRPNLVVHLGDAVEPPRVEAGWARLTAPMARRGIPWCAVLGNHDVDPARGLGHRDVMRLVRALPGCVAGEEAAGLRGGGTFALPILPTEGEAPRRWLWCLDSQESSIRRTLPARAKVGGYGWPTPEHVAWLRRSLAAAEAPGLALCHIPPPEVRELWPDATRPLHPTPVNVGLALALLGSPRALGLAFGHAHGHAEAAAWHGLPLMYGRYSGGPNRRERPQSGVRVIDLEPARPAFATWVWRADGARSEPQTFLREIAPC